MSKPKKSRYEILREERRFKIVPLDINLIGEMFVKPKVKYEFQGLPEDAIFVHADRDIQSQSFQFIYLHESFEPVMEGVVAPSLYVTVTKPEERLNKVSSHEQAVMSKQEYTLTFTKRRFLDWEVHIQDEMSIGIDFGVTHYLYALTRRGAERKANKFIKKLHTFPKPPKTEVKKVLV